MLGPSLGQDLGVEEGTPVALTTGAQFSLNIFDAIRARGVRFVAYTGTMNAQRRPFYDPMDDKAILGNNLFDYGRMNQRNFVTSIEMYPN